MNSKCNFSPEDVLEDILGLLDDDRISQKIDEPIDHALESFQWKATSQFCHSEFNRIIAEFMQHLYRNGLRLSRNISTQKALIEAISILKRSYRGVYTKGYDGALLDAVSSNMEGVETILSSLTNSVKTVERGKYVQLVFAQKIDQLDWGSQCEIVSVFLKKHKDSLPQQIRRTDPARWAEHLPELITQYMSSENLIRSIFMT